MLQGFAESEAIIGYAFIDAENHYLRTTAVAKAFASSDFGPDAFALATESGWGSMRYFPSQLKNRRFKHDAECQLFWDGSWLSGHTERDYGAIRRVVHVGSFCGEDDALHGVRSRIRDFGFEPLIVKEKKGLKRRRLDKAAADRPLDKPKGCDIALATRMVADAAAGLYDVCHLFTSDADFLPAVEAVRRMGKIVCVYGVGKAVADSSPYRYVPDRFVDLTRHFNEFRLNSLRLLSEAVAKLDPSVDGPLAGDEGDA